MATAPEHVALVARHIAEAGLADAASRSPAWPRTRLELAGRARDDAQHLGGRRLLLQRLGELARALLLGSRTAARSRSRSPPGRRRWSTSSICLSVNGATVLRIRTMTPIGAPFAQQRNAEHGPEAADPGPLHTCIPDRPERRERGRLRLRARLARRAIRRPGCSRLLLHVRRGRAESHSWPRAIVHRLRGGQMTAMIGLAQPRGRLRPAYRAPPADRRSSG